MPEHHRILNCAACIELASDYVDGVLPAARATAVETHGARCVECARYLRVLTRGLELARDISVVQPSPDFQWRLDRQLRAIDEAMSDRQRSVRSGAALAVAVAGIVAFMAWSPILSTMGPSPGGSRGDVAARPAMGDEARSEGWEWWYNGVEPAAMKPPNANNAFPGPYSPLYVEPPLGGGRARTVLISLISAE